MISDITEASVTITPELISSKPTDDGSSTLGHKTTIGQSTNSSIPIQKGTELDTTTVQHTTKSSHETTFYNPPIEEIGTTPPTTAVITTERYKYPQPKPDNGYAGSKPHSTRRPDQISSETSEMVALIIGIIAGALIAVILIMLIILRFKSRNHHSFKIEDSKGFQQGPNAALLGNSSSNGQMNYQINGALRNGDKSQSQKAKKRDSKDIKEWYV